jgi:hypothetical protein
VFVLTATVTGGALGPKSNNQSEEMHHYTSASSPTSPPKDRLLVYAKKGVTHDWKQVRTGICDLCVCFLVSLLVQLRALPSITGSAKFVQ